MTTIVSPTCDETALGPEAEAEWQRLRRQFELASGFWLGFVFCSSPRTVATLRHRAERLLRFRALRLRLIRPDSPDELRAILTEFDHTDVWVDCIWIEAVHSDPQVPSGSEPGPWTAAWDWVMLRLNEHRDALRRRVRCGVVFIAPPEWKSRVRDAAPDLWSARSLVLDLHPSAEWQRQFDRRNAMDTEASARRTLSDTAIDVDFALAEARRIEGKSQYDPQSLARVLLRAVEGLLAQDRTEEAVHLARKTVTMLRTVSERGRLLAEALMWAGQAERADDDVAAAIAHLDEAARVWRHALERDGETPQTLRDLAISVSALGNVLRDVRDLAAAEASFEECLALHRHVVDTVGEISWTLRDLSVGLVALGDVRQESGNLKSAALLFEESLALSRRLSDMEGESPQTLRDVALGASRLGDVRRESGNLVSAKALCEESLALCRRAVELEGENSCSLRDLSINLEILGIVYQESGELTSASALFEESLVLRHRLLEMTGENPRSLRDVSSSLVHLGLIQQESGDLPSASVSFEEASALLRRILEAAGESPQRLYDLSFSLRKLGEVVGKMGDLESAADLFRESISLRIRFRHTEDAEARTRHRHGRT